MGKIGGGLITNMPQIMVGIYTILTTTSEAYPLILYGVIKANLWPPMTLSERPYNDVRGPQNKIINVKVL